MVFAAASLDGALSEIAAAYESRSKDAVSFNFAGSNLLARQILAGAPADVFFSADSAQMDVVERAGLVAARDRVDLLSNALVVVVPADGDAPPTLPQDLVRVERLALADPRAVPAGLYARRWLESLGLWEEIEGHVVPLQDVRAALAAVASGNADAAVVYASDALGSERVRIAFRVPPAAGPEIVYVVAPLVGARETAARRLVEWLQGPEAAQVFRNHGFLVRAAR
jgi:molybdate transport system substrate-binding protein